VVDLAGIDQVGIALIRTSNRACSERIPTRSGRGEAHGFFPAVAAEMLNVGFTPEEIGRIGGGNFFRVFGKVTGAGARR
jgi:microsomal dipeptidase-like Zn-dependent dipeptidase